MGIFELPDDYLEIKRINIQKNKKLCIFINAAALIVAALLAFVGFLITPVGPFVIGAENFFSVWLGLITVFVLIILYLLGHELMHGIFIKKYSGKKAKYGFTGLYAYAGSDACFNKRQYLVIALAPVIFFGVVFLALNFLLSAKWFWPIYLLQIFNISGAVGDFFITYLIFNAPADVLTRDEGIEMVFYSREKEFLK